MPDSFDNGGSADDDLLDRRLRALVVDAGAGAPEPPDFRRVVVSDQLSAGSDRSSEGRRLAVGFGAGALVVAAAMALFFVVPRGEDDTLVVSDIETLSTPDPTVDTSPFTAQTDPRPESTEPVVTTTLAPETTNATVVGQPIMTTPPATTTVPTTNLPTTSTPATNSPATNSPATGPPDDPAAIDVVDVSGGTVFGVRIFDAVDVDAVADGLSARLGSPTLDTGWESMTGQVECTGSTDFRVLWWGDFRMTFERYQDGGAARDELSAWSVGDPTLFGFVPIGALPATSPSNIVTLEGIGLGSARADVEAVWTNIFDAANGRLVVADSGGSLTITLDDADRVVGFGNGPFDCPVDEAR